MNIGHVIEFQKGSTFFIVLIMMGIYAQWENPTAWVYLALHGSYGFLWVLKGQLFPDRQWNRNVSLPFAMIGFVALCLYWIAPFLLTSRNTQAPYWLITASIILFVFGVFLNFTADMQKFTSLKLRPDHLITEGIWSITRNPNYLGELLIYLSFAMLSMHWLSFVILLLWVLLYWLPNMHKKDRSLSRYPGFTQYKKSSRLFIPFIF
jgi:protein-S-isoprenylcysteine O-methyltransferase Ste14